MMSDKTEMHPRDIEHAVDEAIDAAIRYVDSLPNDENSWGDREFTIADTAAREAIARLHHYMVRRNALDKLAAESQAMGEYE